jgi:hypothetical protein
MLLREQQESIKQRDAETGGALAKLHERTEILENLAKDQADVSAGYRSVLNEIEVAQVSMQRRLDRQAEAIRTLHAVTRSQVGHHEELRSALQRLEEIAGRLDAPQALPEDL